MADALIEPRAPWGVAALLLAVGDALAARFGALSVRGEIAGFARAASGHCYFTLKDTDGAAASLRCAMFRRAAGLIDFAPADGQQVELRGRLAVYDARGELQFIAEAMRPLGAGNLYEQFLRLKAKLEAEGLFDAARKRPLPGFARRIGVITSLGAAALHDVLTTLARRAPQVRVVVYPSPVQGAEAPAALVRALALAAARNEVDLLILARGGGSLEDLWAFNDERVVRAVAASALPLVCGVGHETDCTLADLAADLRAPTPTAAAELAAPAQVVLRARLDTLAQRAMRQMSRRLEAQAQRLDARALQLARPAQSLALHQQRLDRLQSRLRASVLALLGARQRTATQWATRLAQAQQQRRAQAQSRLAVLQARLDSLAPQRVLQRGYAWVADEAGRPIVSAYSLQPGQSVRAVWHDGSASATVSSVERDPPRTE
jgi:exodeoxyribonuclease VII large subunit